MNRTYPGERGVTYLLLMASLVVIGITAMAVGQQWRMIAKRDREAELLFRGDQIKRAIESYYRFGQFGRSGSPGLHAYPSSLQDLLLVRDAQTGRERRFLRRPYHDPMNTGEWVLVYDLTGGIRGVHSPSDAVPLKQANFPPGYSGFEGKRSYRDWVFEVPASPL